MDKVNDFGFSFTDTDAVEEAKEYARKQVAAADNYKTQLSEMHTLFSILLDNLRKNPEKDIHWPNRDKKIADIQAKIDRMLLEE